MITMPIDITIKDIDRAPFLEVERIAQEMITQLEDLEEKRRYLYKILKQHKLFDVFKDLVLSAQYTLYHYIKYNIYKTLGDKEKICLAIINRNTNIPICKPLYEYIIASLDEKDIVKLVTTYSMVNIYGKYVVNKHSLGWEPDGQKEIEKIIRFDKILTK